MRTRWHLYAPVLTSLLVVSCASTQAPETLQAAKHDRCAAKVLASLPQQTNGGEYFFVGAPYAFVGRWGSGLRIYDLSDPRVPQLVGEFLGPYTAQSAAIKGTNVCALGRIDKDSPALTGLNVIDVSNPQAPAILGTAPLDALTPRGIVAEGDFAYCFGLVGESLPQGGLQDTCRLMVFDIHNPEKPIRRGTMDTQGNPIALETDGKYLYMLERVSVSHLDTIATRSETLRIIDVRDPDAPKVIAQIDADPHNTDFTVYGFRIFMTTRDRLRIYDISQHAAPRLLGELPIGPHSGLLVQSTHRALVLQLSESHEPCFSVIDVSRAKRPTKIGEVILSESWTRSGPIQIEALSDGVLVSLGDGQLKTIQLSGI